MSMWLSRSMMTLAARCLGEHRRAWSDAMAAEYETAAADGTALSFAAGCLIAAWREMLTTARGNFVLASYALALILMLPIAALQIGCALFGLPYLYPAQTGLSGSLLEGGAHEHLLREIYQAAVPSLALIQLLVGVGHLRLAWLLLERDWAGVRRAGMRALAAAVTLILLMGVLFLDSRQAVLQVVVLAFELAILFVVIRWHTELFPAECIEQPG